MTGYRVTNLVGTPTDYSDRNNWAHLPEIADKAVDTVFFYPTVYINPLPGAPDIVPLDSRALRAGVRNNYGQAPKLFEDLTNLYEPYYRQSNLSALSKLKPEELMPFQMREQRTDIYAALDYFFEHFNQGRPFILAGHSQGSIMLKIALTDYFLEHSDYLDRMVAAYVVGYSVTPDDLAANPALKFAEGADDTGVIVSWNTEGPENRHEHNCVVKEHALAINPINWKRDDTYAFASENLGDCLPLYDKTGFIAIGYRPHTPGIADAQLNTERGVVVCTTMRNRYIKMFTPSKKNIFGPASLHLADYSAYWENIRGNVRTRIEAYFRKNPGTIGEKDMKPFIGIPTDYSLKKNWLSQPENPDKPVDVIFLYPSSCQDMRAGVICAVDNRSMLRTARRNFAQQATAFLPVANLYAPFWRQVNGMKLSKMSFEEVDRAEWAEPRTDVYAALDYYFENLNQGRPYFLAGHSQGSRLCYMVLSEYMKEHPDYYANMIAAYCLGDSLTRDYLEANPHVKAAQAADDVGVVVSWNTEGPENKGKPSLVVSPGAISINPLNWRTDDTPASADLNLGSYMPFLLLPRLRKLRVNADAVIDPERGTVIVTEPRLKKCAITALPGMKHLESVFGPASYHGCDYSFFYKNIRKNARARIKAWFAK